MAEIHSIGYELCIDDDEITGVKSICQEHTNDIDSIMTEYNTIMNEVLNEAVMAGEFHKSIKSYTEMVEKVHNEHLNTICEEIKSEIEEFLKNFDTADNCLY